MDNRHIVLETNGNEVTGIKEPDSKLSGEEFIKYHFPKLFESILITAKKNKDKNCATTLEHIFPDLGGTIKIYILFEKN